MLLYEDLKLSAKVYPEKTALVYKTNKIRYSEVLRCVDILSSTIVKRNITRNKRVGLVLYNSIEFVLCLYALSKNNNVTCLLNPNTNMEELVQKIELAKIDIVIIEGALYRKLYEYKEKMNKTFNIITNNSNGGGISLQNIMHTYYNHISETSGYDINHNTLIQTSSGTTNTSKMAYRTHKNIHFDMENIVTTFDYNEKDNVYTMTPFCHGYGLTMGLIAPIRCGATIILDKWFLVNRFFLHYEELKPSILIGTPEIYNIINNYIGSERYSLDYSRFAICSGEALTERIGEEFFVKTGFWINQIYGMMEASTISANLSPNRANFLSVGREVNNVHLIINTEANVPNNYGEVFVKSEAVSSKYLGIDKDLDIKSDDGWFRTKDIGIREADGNIKLTARAEIV